MACSAWRSQVVGEQPESRGNGGVALLDGGGWREPELCGAVALLEVPELTAGVPEGDAGDDQCQDGKAKPYGKCHALLIHKNPLARAVRRGRVGARRAELSLARPSATSPKLMKLPSGRLFLSPFVIHGLR